ncbi:hypothetical protein E3O11_03420 [Cryobacterium levicorallinum]|jgi:hypothetical protein|uniref:DUF2384 domain-containing protein n=1 Tax=Cryobacterium levicorallinum TaxID=995038 RepID=A0A1I3CP56_9MICO|nr:hypothetical protein [Cryobacterium levicorallinum]TFB87867.1 hypothetical protein E3O11_03420 [Cryobacterium levicorallinum]GEP27814.1 hypothetical protein CLE01_24120 [Cryobacterium levicorallinum]SFH76314.1 hypothetical protein SAMN05216274_11438 [Cryobacterium levicorallinum]
MNASEPLSTDELWMLKQSGIDVTDPGLDGLYEQVVARSNIAFAAHKQMPLDDIAVLLGVPTQELIDLLGEQSAWDASWIMSTPQRQFATDGSDRTPMEYLEDGGDRQDVLDLLADSCGW